MSRPVIISASRRTDLVGCYPEVLWEQLQKFPPGDVHSTVLWTKNPQTMLIGGPSREKLLGYRQL